jgi:hypothetical protein
MQKFKLIHLSKFIFRILNVRGIPVLGILLLFQAPLWGQ